MITLTLIFISLIITSSIFTAIFKILFGILGFVFTLILFLSSFLVLGIIGIAIFVGIDILIFSIISKLLVS